MNDIFQIVKTNIDHPFKIVEKTKVTDELYFVGEKTETVRSTSTTDTLVTVYVSGDDGTLGDSTFPVYPSMDTSDVCASLQKAVARAKLVHNKPYDFADCAEENSEIPSNVKDGKEAAKAVANAIFDCPLQGGTSINALEIFVSKITTRVRLSNGLDKTQTKHEVAFEAIPTHTDEKESVELYQWYESTNLDAKDIQKEITDKINEVKARHEAQKGKPQTIDVAFRPEEIEELIFTLADELSYKATYSKSNAFGPGDNLQENLSGDELTVTMKASVPGSTHSATFDEDGTTLKDKTVIEKGKAVSLWGDLRYGQYLGKTKEEITGRTGCVELNPGTLEKPEGTYLECVSLSGLQLETYSDYIGGEIRLAYLHENGKVTPVTGISMSGKLSRVLPSLRLTKDKIVRGAYQGPSLMLLKNMQIV